MESIGLTIDDWGKEYSLFPSIVIGQWASVNLQFSIFNRQSSIVNPKGVS
jgi:hypothetical protein